jgi:hypothetical protein
MGSANTLWLCIGLYGFYAGTMEMVVALGSSQMASSMRTTHYAIVFCSDMILSLILQTAIQVVLVSYDVSERGMFLGFGYAMMALQFLAGLAVPVVLYFRRKRHKQGIQGIALVPFLASDKAQTDVK